eukprot:scaffold65022_cov57-Phaeocystis_antarctica.AAC.1
MQHSEPQRGHCRQRVRAQPLSQPLHAVENGCTFEEDQRLEHWQPQNQRPQRPQLLAAPHPQLEAQCCCRLVLSPQPLPQRLRLLPQLMAGAAEGHGDARLDRVAQPFEDDAHLVTAEPR